MTGKHNGDYVLVDIEQFRKQFGAVGVGKADVQYGGVKETLFHPGNRFTGRGCCFHLESPGFQDTLDNSQEIQVIIDYKDAFFNFH